jgi:TatD DNase family protein
MTLEYIDTHCHLNHADYANDLEEVRERAAAAGVTRMLCIGYDRNSSQRAVELTHFSEIYAAVGIHPESADEWSAETAGELEALYQGSAGKVMAYGEIGLDYHWETVPRTQQQEVFAAQIAFARNLSPGLPLIVHNREALEDILAVLRGSETAAPVVMHCFTRDRDTARQCLEAGYYLGIGGVVTFKKSEAVRDAVAYAPLDRLLLETDCPYLAPQFKRGRRNEPSYLPAIAETVASAKGITVEEVAAVTTANARKLLGLA